MLDFDSYLRRIGLDPADKPTWQAVHRAHATRIPFENLDSHRGIPISLAQADLERKLVASLRGGYCFEHNLLLASALEHLGLGVEPMLARVSAGGAARETRPAGHLVLRVTDRDGHQWHADVGFGLGTLLDPIPFGPTGVHEQSGWSFKVVAGGGELALQTLRPDGWTSVYTFPPRPAFLIDIEVSNWWTCTSPASPFVSGLIVAVSHDDGRREALHDFSGPLLTTASSPHSTETTQAERGHPVAAGPPTRPAWLRARAGRQGHRPEPRTTPGPARLTQLWTARSPQAAAWPGWAGPPVAGAGRATTVPSGAPPSSSHVLLSSYW